MNYLYNGVELPDLNTVWTDKEAYPYATLFALQGTKKGKFALLLTSCPTKFVSYTENDILVNAIYSVKECNTISYNTDIPPVEFIYLKTSYYEDSALLAGLYYSSTGTVKDVLWSNYNILNEDGSVYLAKTDPIPVGGEPLDPTSLLMGYRVGEMIRGMRKQQKEDV